MVDYTQTFLVLLKQQYYCWSGVLTTQEKDITLKATRVSPSINHSWFRSLQRNTCGFIRGMPMPSSLERWNIYRKTKQKKTKQNSKKHDASCHIHVPKDMYMYQMKEGTKRRKRTH